MTSPISDERLKEFRAAVDDVTVDKYRPGFGHGIIGYVQVPPEDMESIVTELLAAREALIRIARMEGTAGFEDSGPSTVTSNGEVSHGRVKVSAFANDIAARALDAKPGNG